MSIIGVPSEELSEVKLVTTGLYCPCLTHTEFREKTGEFYGLRSNQCVSTNKSHVLNHADVILSL